ncbi:MAG: hypothetical protein AABW64_01240 [Nanoarchaeota archaeon]
MKYGPVHLHRRKRIHQYYEKYPHPNSRIRFLDHLVMAVAVIGPLTTAPQIYKIFMEKTAVGISLFTWSAYLILTLPLLVYGIVHRDKQLITMYILWIIVDGVVVVGTLMYG